ncbi:MAG TPA: nucleoside 2-deoxyribosyltransferase [Methanoregulaceae archaeon]|nr:MAG: nucleoside 2-deoxyribosyltransferase [Methanolinea sp.]HON80686.1 nucleoside 2-deoxyribosyltransferase [Methanoregulaceae archaeon]HPD09420.1 nucleoside 2-deoxyribosyltransferase [Methanoregulaceae archaeon]HRT14787.1 nucleoside 2-deoxyribosyltransferase [Methanoregulaceae archaeon]HRU30360.1 nucleoside 2-deoxyribosyltransferase [Methanoregulaceae archaeon]
MYVLLSPCILNPGLRARGITREEDVGWYSRALERCRRFGIEAVPLPCPETLYLGPDREPAMFLDQLNTPEFFCLLGNLETEVRSIIDERGPPLCIIGVNSSPACGVDATYYGPAGSANAKRSGRGAFLARFPEIPALDVADFARFRLYLAAPLFSRAEKEYNISLFETLSAHFFEVYLPQEIGDDTHHRDREAHRTIFDRHIAALGETDIVVAVIDGADADSGTAWEMGYAYAHGIPVIAIRTDFRMAGQCEQVNLMLEQSARVVRSNEDLLAALKAPPLPEGRT